MEQVCSKVTPAGVGAQVGLQACQIGINSVVRLAQGGASCVQTHVAQKGLDLATGFIEGGDTSIQATADVEGRQIQRQTHQSIPEGVGDVFIRGVAHLLAHASGNLACGETGVELWGQKGLQKRNVLKTARVGQPGLLINRVERHRFGELRVAEAKGTMGKFSQNTGIKTGVVVVRRSRAGESPQIGCDAPSIFLQHMVLIEVLVGQLGQLKKLLSR